jgi:nitrite reductase (NADH) small subunit
MTALDDRPIRAHELIPVCRYADLQPDRGVAALLPGGDQVAVFLLGEGSLHAVSNIDPFSGAGVLSRGIVGDRAGTPVVVSPVYKQAFDLRTGACLDEQGVALRVFRVVHDGDMVWVGQ